jgi:adenylate cyclase
MFIRFFNPPEKYPSISLIDILQPKSPEEDEKNKELLSGKIVLIGEYGTLIHDDHFSPVDTRGKMPGVEFHANVIDGLLQNKSLISQSSTSLWLTLVLFSAGLILLFFAIPTHIAIVVFIVFLFLLILV